VVATTGKRAFLDLLKQEGVEYIFGNPGTTELPLMDALATETDLRYVLGLQEAAVMAMADGYAMASGQLGVVNLHISCGLGNAMGMLYNAYREGTPLIVTAGQQDTRLLLGDPILAADLVQLTEQFTKWSHEIRSAAEAPHALRRAIELAVTPPTGPVFLALPMDLMSESVDAEVVPPSAGSARAEPAPEAIAQAAMLLAKATSPLIVAGDGVARSGARAELQALAELLGAAVHGEPIHRRASFPADHALWRGGLFPAAANVRKSLERADCVLIVGASVFTWLFHTPGAPFRPGVPVVQLDEDAREIGKSYAVTHGIVADVRAALRALRSGLDARLGAAQRAAAAERAAALGRARADHARRLAADAADAAGGATNSMSLSRITRPGADSTARAMVLSSSRMLPGQSY